MADAIIGALRVLLNLDTAAFSSGAKQAEGTLDSLAKNFKKILAAVSIAKVAHDFTQGVKSMIDEADNIGKAAQKFGVPVEQLSALKYAAELADVSFESLGKGLGKLSKAMLSGATEPAGEVAKSFKAMGVSITDSAGKLREPNEVFLDIAEKFSKVEDGAAKTALAIKLFGKSGADLIPLLNEGRSGIKGLTDEATKLGIVISEKTAQAAQQFNDNLKRLHTVQGAAYLQIAEGMLPALLDLTERFIDVTREGKNWTAVGKLIGDGLTQIVNAGSTAIQFFAALAKELKAYDDVAKTIPYTEARTKALENLTKATSESTAMFQRAKDGVLHLQAPMDAFGDGITYAGKRAAKASEEINTAVMNAKNPIDQFLLSQMKSIEATKAQAASIGGLLGVYEGEKIVLEARAVAAQNQLTMTDKQIAQLDVLKFKASEAAVGLAAANLKQDLLTPWQQYELQLARIIQMQGTEFPLSLQEAAQANMIAAAKMAQTYGDAAGQMMGSFSDLFKTMGKGNKDMYAIAKAFSISQAIINVLVGVTKAIAQGGVLGAMMGASVLATGMATVAKIIAEKPPGMATGGTLMVGGAGGVDSKMIPIMASPGEKVTVDQNKYGSDSGGRSITVQGMNAKDYYRGDVMRDLIENINEAIGDGYKIKMA